MKFPSAPSQTENDRYNQISVNSTRNADSLRTEKPIPESCQTEPNSNCILTSPIDLHNANQSEKRNRNPDLVQFNKIQ